MLTNENNSYYTPAGYQQTDTTINAQIMLDESQASDSKITNESQDSNADLSFSACLLDCYITGETTSLPRFLTSVTFITLAIAAGVIITASIDSLQNRDSTGEMGVIVGLGFGVFGSIIGLGACSLLQKRKEALAKSTILEKESPQLRV